MKQNIIPQTRREQFETRMLQRFTALEILKPEIHSRSFQTMQNGSFGFGIAAAAFYANGKNQRGSSRIAPFGLVFDKYDDLFVIGYFRKPGSAENDDGYAMFLCPKGEGVAGVVAGFAEEMLADPELRCAGVYARFLSRRMRDELLIRGFSSVSSQYAPWHQLAPQEDETFCHSRLYLPEVLTLDGTNFHVRDLSNAKDKDHRRKSRMAFQRFGNFLSRNSLGYHLEKMRLDGSDSETAMKIIRSYFASIGETCGSVPEDYLGLVDPKILGFARVHAYLGYLGNVPVSVFIGEELQHQIHYLSLPGQIGIYASISMRNKEEVLPALGLDPKDKRSDGFSAISIVAQLYYFAKLFAQGITLVKLGGSEKKSVDDAKRQLGAEEERTYWVFKGRS